ncbi:ABC transporter substrate-binding protein [Zavarzinia sp. CC-PAN008]|uniref:ABC transporter substrate-binding protein n=1 Tax=Zavarzinia sp. CC-PAN008 TaxID=3243332 RepID=UPI003F7450A3
MRIPFKPVLLIPALLAGLAVQPALAAQATAVPAPAAAASQQDSKAVIEALYADLLDVMQQAKQLSFEQRYDKLAGPLAQAFDLPEMTRIAVGSRWRQMSEQERADLVKAFTNYTVSIYADRFDGWDGQSFQVGEARANPDGSVLQLSQLLQTGGQKPIDLNYVMRRTDAGWRAVDVYLNATISELATRRSEFSSVVRDQGAAGLIALLDRKSREMKAS